MKLILINILAFFGGVCLAVQSGFNTQLSVLLKNPLLAVVCSSFTSACLGCIVIIIFYKGNVLQYFTFEVPWYLWFTGGLFSIIGIFVYFYTIPKLGISRMITLGLCGQIIFSLIAGRLGLFNLPAEPLGAKQLLGAILMLVSIILINSK